MENLKNSEIAEKAIEYLERDGWNRYRTGNHGLPSCIGGALIKAMGRFNYYFDHKNRLYNICEPLLPVWLRVNGQAGALGITTTFAVTAFNDKILNSQEEAIQFLTDAAKYWRDKGE